MDTMDAEISTCTRCQKFRPVNPAGLCPRCQHQADDATAKVKPCIKCGSVEGRPDPRNGRIKRTRGMCSICYDAWWYEHRYKTDPPERPVEPIAACVKCETVGGYIDPRTKRPKRTLGMCHACYADLHNARRRAARHAENARQATDSTATRIPPDLDLLHRTAEAIRQAHAPKIRQKRRTWGDLTPREASRMVRRLWRKRPAVEAFFTDARLIYD